MVALLKHCCCNNYTYHLSLDRFFSPFIYSSNIEDARNINGIIGIAGVPFRYSFLNTNDTSIIYYYKNGSVLDSYFNGPFSTFYVYLRKNITRASFDGLFLSDELFVQSSLNILSFSPDLIKNSLSADSELRSKIVEFVQSIDLKSFLIDNGFSWNIEALFNHFKTFQYKIHVKLDCDIIHTDKYFPDSKSLYPNQIIEVKNINFEVSIV